MKSNMTDTDSALSGMAIECGCSPATATTGRPDTPGSSRRARKIRQQRFVLDGEAVILGVDGIADFNALHSRQLDEEVQLCAFDILVEGSDDLRKLPLHLRKTSLQRLLARRPEGIFVNPFERGEIGPDLFRAACRMGLEGLVSKHRDRPYQSGRSKHWVKVKNRTHPAMYRVMDALG
jgi:bifunctional non-homologous end joining protein LigD